MLEILSPQLKDKQVLGCIGKVVAKASPALSVPESSTQTGLAVSSVENRNDIQQEKGAAGADGGSLVLSLALGSDSGESPLSDTGMRILPSHHKIMRSHPGRWRQGWGEGDEPLSSRLQRFWGTEQAAELDPALWIGGYMSLLIMSSPARLFRLAVPFL